MGRTANNVQHALIKWALKSVIIRFKMVDTTGLAAFGILPKRNYSGRAAIHVSEIIYREWLKSYKSSTRFQNAGKVKTSHFLCIYLASCYIIFCWFSKANVIICLRKDYLCPNVSINKRHKFCCDVCFLFIQRIFLLVEIVTKFVCI